MCVYAIFYVEDDGHHSSGNGKREHFANRFVRRRRRCGVAACGGADGVRDLLTGITDDLAHVMALAGARSVAEIPEVTGPLTGNSLEE